MERLPVVFMRVAPVVLVWWGWQGVDVLLSPILPALPSLKSSAVLGYCLFHNNDHQAQ